MALSWGSGASMAVDVGPPTAQVPRGSTLADQYSTVTVIFFGTAPASLALRR